MGIRKYIAEYWLELWNPDSRAWQHTDRILFILLPIINVVYLLVHYEDMQNLTWIIPLSIWLLFFLLVVPYRLVSKYKKQINEMQDRLNQRPKTVPLTNREALIRAIGIVGQRAKDFFGKQESLYWPDSPHLTAADRMSERDKALTECRQAMNQFENEILVAGKAFQEPLQMLFQFIESQVTLKPMQNLPEEIKSYVLDYLAFVKQLDRQVAVTIRRIEEISRGHIV